LLRDLRRTGCDCDFGPEGSFREMMEMEVPLTWVCSNFLELVMWKLSERRGCFVLLHYLRPYRGVGGSRLNKV